MTEDNTNMVADGGALGRELSTAVVLFHEAVARRLGLSAADHKALDLILRSGPLTAGQIARRTGLTPGAITGLVDRLERAGYVHRRPDQDDRRRVVISALLDRPTELTGIFTELAREIEAFMAKYDEREMAVIIDYLTNTIEVLRAQTSKLGNAVEGTPPGERVDLGVPRSLGDTLK